VCFGPEWQAARESDAQGARGDQEVPQGLRHGAPRTVVYAVQVEEGVQSVWRLDGTPRSLDREQTTPEIRTEE
jgi:hypothetical protein